MTDTPISPLRRRMIEDMTVRNFSEKTRANYIRQIKTFAAFLGRSPDTATAEDLRVAANGTSEVVRFDRRATPMAKRAVSLPISPDNVHWDANGKLLSAGPNVAPASGWSVVELDPETLAFSRLGGADQRAAMQRVSSAMRVGDDIWVASNMDRIARFSLKRP